jgi:hypothetical protein
MNYNAFVKQLIKALFTSSIRLSGYCCNLATHYHPYVFKAYAQEISIYCMKFEFTIAGSMIITVFLYIMPCNEVSRCQCFVKLRNIATTLKGNLCSLFFDERFLSIFRTDCFIIIVWSNFWLYTSDVILYNVTCTEINVWSPWSFLLLHVLVRKNEIWITSKRIPHEYLYLSHYSMALGPIVEHWAPFRFLHLIQTQ